MGVPMQKQKRNKVVAMLEQLLPVVLAVICILVVTLNTRQANLPVPIPVKFEGEYSFDGGESWHILTDESDLSTTQGDVLLRGHFDEELFPGAILYLYRDHFGFSVTLNDEIYFTSIQYEVMEAGDAGKAYRADVCSKEWTLIEFENGLDSTDVIKIHLKKMHSHIDRNAYRNLLNTCYVGPIDTMIVESYLQPYVTPAVIFGGLLLIVAVMMLGAAIASAFLQTGMAQSVSKLGFLLLFAGGFLLLDTITVPLWSDTLVFNTYARQICMMLATYWMGLSIRDILTGRGHKIARIVMMMSLVLNVVLILPSFTGTWAIYDTMPAWLAGQVIFSLVLLAASIAEIRKGFRKNRLLLCSGILLMITLLLDIAGVASSVYSHGTCTKVAFVLLFMVYGSRMLKRVVTDYQEARRAKKLEKELEDSRIAIMLSQIQPHFIHNILNVIYYMCGKDPAVAQEAISKFSDYLRNNLEAISQKELITFRKELDHIQTYLELEQIRFGEELSVVFDIEEDSFLLPVLTIQPLVENAVKHGIAKKRGGGVVTISSCQTESAYEITVVDTGAGFDMNRYMNDGKVHVGLDNVRQRLANRMNATVDIVTEPGKGTTVTVTIPKEKVS